MNVTTAAVLLLSVSQFPSFNIVCNKDVECFINVDIIYFKKLLSENCLMMLRSLRHLLMGDLENRNAEREAVWEIDIKDYNLWTG